MAKIERKYLAHFIDVNFNVDADNPTHPSGTGVTPACKYLRLGKDLESFAEELSPQVNVVRNILGEQSVIHNGYQVQSDVNPFYAESGEEIWEALQNIANKRLNGDDCRTTRVEALFHLGDNDALVCDWAYREDCWVVPQSLGGDTSGVQIPFQILNCGNRVPGEMEKSSTTGAWTFTKDT